MALFQYECDQHFLLLTVDRIVIDRAVALTQKYRLRGYDAVQLATALVNKEILTEENLAEPCFVAGDNDLLEAAKSEKLEIENPQNHLREKSELEPEDQKEDASDE